MASQREDDDDFFDEIDENNEVAQVEECFNFDVVKVGNRSTSKVYLQQQFGYSSDKYRNGKHYLKCYFKRESRCTGRAVISSGFLEKTQEHTCEPDATYWEIKQAKNEMKEKAGRVPDDFAKIHRETLNDFGIDVASQIPFKAMKSTMKKVRKRRYFHIKPWESNL